MVWSDGGDSPLALIVGAVWEPPLGGEVPTLSRRCPPGALRERGVLRQLRSKLQSMPSVSRSKAWRQTSSPTADTHRADMGDHTTYGSERVYVQEVGLGREICEQRVMPSQQAYFLVPAQLAASESSRVTSKIVRSTTKAPGQR